MTKLFPGKKDSGVAIIMVMSAIAILSIVLTTFTYDTELNKIKIYNYQDRVKAKLNAESGLNFAMAKLKLYREAFKTLNENESLKNVMPENVVQSIITQPFVFPPPIPQDADILEKNAVGDFMKSAILEGGVSVTISPISGFLNPNNLRLPELKDSESESSKSEEEKKADSSKEIHTQVEKELLAMLTKAIESKKESNEDFNILYSDIEPEKLIKELKFFVNARGKYEDDYTSVAENLYAQKEMTPKHAPLTSTSELFLLAGWDDAIINLIIDRLTVHEVGIIPINQLTENQLKIIFPDITEEQSTDFFHYRDGNPEATDDEDEDNSPHPFKNETEFKTIVTGRLSIVDTGTYDERMKELKKAGLKLGVSGKLFKVVSRGSMNNSSYTLTAIVDLPVKEAPKKKTDSETSESKSEDDESTESKTESKTDNKTDKKEEPTELLAPRIIDLIIN